MTWNSFGAARGPVSFVRWRGVADAHRFEHPILRKTAAEIDVFCMQEIYLSESEEFFDALAHDHKVRDDNALRVIPLSFGGSGLGLASRLPIVAHRARAFERPQASAERFARKGMLHARVRVGARDVDVITTHMQSGEGSAARAIRKRQLVELRRFATEVGNDDIPMIVCGDFNIDGLGHVRAGDYAEIARALPGFVDIGADADHVTFDTTHNPLARKYTPREPRQRLDYVFVRDPKHVLALVAIERALHEALGDTVASDHYALRAIFEVR
jgi:endonuclease/exonuclease/phosphatase family metal-dependent hydrolase